MTSRRESEHKIYVKVRADFDFDGRLRPLMLRTQDGAPQRIDRVTDVRQAASLKAGGQGMRYICRVADGYVLLFHDEPLWFVEL